MTIGLIGGMSWQSTAHYYELLNKMINDPLGRNHSAKLLLYSIDFEELAERQFANQWAEAEAMMIDAAKRLERGGADFILLCANTEHIATEAVERSIQIPLLHIADATGARIVSRGIRRVGMLGTTFVMDREFYRNRLRDKFELEVIIPGTTHRKLVHDVIFNELVRGVVNPTSKANLREVISALIAAGAEGVVLGCTELTMITDQADSAVPLFDTTTIHSEAAVDCALRNDAILRKGFCI